MSNEHTTLVRGAMSYNRIRYNYIIGALSLTAVSCSQRLRFPRHSRRREKKRRPRPTNNKVDNILH